MGQYLLKLFLRKEDKQVSVGWPNWFQVCARVHPLRVLFLFKKKYPFSSDVYSKGMMKPVLYVVQFVYFVKYLHLCLWVP